MLIKAVRDNIKQKEEQALNYSVNRPTNNSTKSLNSKLKFLMTKLRGMSDFPFFLFRLTNVLSLRFAFTRNYADESSLPLPLKQAIHPAHLSCTTISNPVKKEVIMMNIAK